MDRHSVTFVTSHDGERGAQNWEARCQCGEGSGPTTDGLLSTARIWRNEHWDKVGVKHTEAADAVPLDAPDPRPDSYDAWLRGLTNQR